MRKVALFDYWWLGTTLLTLLGLFFLSWPYVISAHYLSRGSYFLDSGEVEPTIDNLTAAMNFEPTNVLASRRLAQAYLGSDQSDQALAVAQQAVALAPDNPLPQLELGDMYDRLGKVEQAIAHYEAGQVGDRRVPLIANYLQLAERLWRSGNEAEAVAIWQDKVHRLNSGNLYANWRLAQYYAADPEAAAAYQDSVRYFPLDSVAVPPDRRLDDYQVQAFAGALADGLWARETWLNVVAYRVWQDQSQTTEHLLQSLLAMYPTDADLHFYLAEMYQRQGEDKQAEVAYQYVLELDPNYIQAYLRLGEVVEASCESGDSSCVGLETAANWYKQYHQLAPDDPIGLQKLTKIYESLGKPEAAALRAELKVKTDERYVVANLLGLPVERVELGPDLVENGTFEVWSEADPDPFGWRYGTYLGQTGGLYLSGKDTIAAEDQVARLISLWGGLMPDGTTAYAEYVGQAFSVANTKYLVSLYYRSQNFIEGSGFVFLGDYTHSDGLVMVYSPLPVSNGQWRVTHFLVDRPAEPEAVTPLVRNWGEGQLEIRAFTVKPVTISE
jgi:tetratricopeptide (TPR) repeat protein